MGVVLGTTWGVGGGGCSGIFGSVGAGENFCKKCSQFLEEVGDAVLRVCVGLFAACREIISVEAVVVVLGGGRLSSW